MTLVRLPIDSRSAPGRLQCGGGDARHGRGAAKKAPIFGEGVAEVRSVHQNPPQQSRFGAVFFCTRRVGTPLAPGRFVHRCRCQFGGPMG